MHEDVIEATATYSPEWAIPNFDADKQYLSHYEQSRARAETRAFADVEREIDLRTHRRLAAIQAQAKAAAELVTTRDQEYNDAHAAYIAKCPHLIKNKRLHPPGFFENLFSFGKKGRLFRRLMRATEKKAEARSQWRRTANVEERVAQSAENEKKLQRERTKELVKTPEWLAQFEDSPQMKDLASQVRKIRSERESYAARLEKGQVPPGEARDRLMAERKIRPLSIPCEGMLIVEVQEFVGEAYFILSDLEGHLFWMGYVHPPTPAFYDFSFDVYRILDKWSAKPHNDANGVAMKSINHFLARFPDDAARGRQFWRKRAEGLNHIPRYTDTVINEPTMQILADVLREFAQACAVAA